MNDRVVASMHSSGVQLELTALAWRRTSLSGPSHSISSSLALAGAVLACEVCRPRGQRFSNRPLRHWITAKSHVRQRQATRLPRGQVTQEWR